MSKIVITGAGGFLGLHIAKLLSKNNDHTIINISRNHHVELDQLGIRTIECDISKKEDVEAIDLTNVEAIFFFFSIAGVWGRRGQYYQVNYLGTVNLVNHAKKSDVPNFIYTSTPSVVFGDQDIVLGDEGLEYPKKYYTDYAYTKSLAEKYVKEQCNSSFKAICLRPHLIWGPGDPHLIPRIITKAKQGRLKMVGEGENLVDIIYVKNAALAHIQAWMALKENPLLSGNCYFIGQERPVNLWDFINQVLALKKVRPVSGYISFNMAYKIGWLMEIIYKFLGIYKPEPPMTRFVAMQLAKSHYFSHAKAREDFGYEPLVSIESGLKETFAD